MRQFLPVIGMFALAACEPAIPDSGAGVGFGDYNEYMRAQSAQSAQPRAAEPRQTAALQPPGAPLSAIPALDAPAADQGWQTADDDSPDALAREALAAIGGGAAASAPQAGDGPAEWPVATASGVSQQTFDPSAPRDETAAERNARLAAQYETVAPEALPERPADTTNIVAYALSTTHRVGQERHRRSPIQFRNHERACAQFASQDLAQEEFLLRGGPERDPLNLDPDGDGFACWWDPEPFRAAARGAAQQ
ncbi:hypothetical protein [Alkalilacustris brevis]|uniref:hypothetical protein n=1 Tax=Alkalilacustris brevis TaxID=2026338 RepID=UPI000E0DA015|nr:hypothetical protein [Alkalilacustris brevis]